MTHSTAPATIRPVIFPLFVALLAVACHDDPTSAAAPVIGIAPSAGGEGLVAGSIGQIKGRVTSAATGTPVAGAVVRIGDAADTTGPSGRFHMTALSTGLTTLRSSAAGFADFETAITVMPGSVMRDVEMTRIEVFEFGDFALYVPATVDAPHGLLLALGGPDTRGFVTGKRVGAPFPDVEASLQMLGASFRALASLRGLAVLGTRRAGIPNSPASDTLLLEAVEAGAAVSGRPNLPFAHMLLYAASGGARQASGFTARNPERVAGVFLKVPASVSSVTSGEAVGVPTYVVQAELDAFVNNAAVEAAFEGNRAAGALWALAKERGVPHHSLSVIQRQVTINWMSTILDRRLRFNPGRDPLVRIAASSGWLGDLSTGEAAPWGTYSGDRAFASWLPSESTAHDWEAFVAASPVAVTASRQ
jgi:hypothetical protein